MADQYVFSVSFDKHMKQWDSLRQKLTKGIIFESQKRRLRRDTFEMGGLDANFAQGGKCLYLRLWKSRENVVHKRPVLYEEFWRKFDQ